MTSPKYLPKQKKPSLFLLRRVLGESMAPTLAPGKVILAVRSQKIRPGHVVVIWHEGLDKIKRVVDMRPGEVFVKGDNEAGSTDSRSFGWLPIEAILARVIWPQNLTNSPR